MARHVPWISVALFAVALMATSPDARTPTATLALGGDVHFGRWSGDTYRPTPPPATDEELRRRFTAADLALINLETAICHHDEARASDPLFADQVNRFTAEPPALDWLVDLGVDAAIVANNHALDCGPDSLTHTVTHLDERRIVAAGLGPPAELTIGDHPVLVLAITAHPPRINPGDHPSPKILWNRTASRRALLSRVEDLRADHPDALIIVSLHWGEELAAEPSPDQRRLAHGLLDAGADLLYGHGPHVVQEVEHSGPGAIVYSAGNLRFDMRHPDTLTPGLIEIDLFRVDPSPSGSPWKVRAR